MKWFAQMFMAAALAAVSLSAGCGETVGTTPVGGENSADGNTGGDPTDTLGQVTGLIASRLSNTVQLNWTPVSDAYEYEITRHNSVVEVLGTVASTSYVDDLSAKPELLRETLGYSIRAVAADGSMGKPSDTQTVAPPIEFGTIRVTAFLGDEEVRGANVFLDGTDTGERTPCELGDVPTGQHVISLAPRTGLMSYDEEIVIEVEADGAINVVGDIVNDLGYTWIDRETREEREWEVRSAEEAQSYLGCGDGLYVVGPRGTALCMERDNSLSLCKDRAEECGMYGEGEVLNEGTRVHFRAYNVWDDSLAFDRTFERLR